MTSRGQRGEGGGKKNGNFGGGLREFFMDFRWNFGRILREFLWILEGF